MSFGQLSRSNRIPGNVTFAGAIPLGVTQLNPVNPNNNGFWLRHITLTAGVGNEFCFVTYGISPPSSATDFTHPMIAFAEEVASIGFLSTNLISLPIYLAPGNNLYLASNLAGGAFTIDIDVL